VQQVGGVGYAEFLFPGLVMMSMVQNAFANTSSSLVIAKIQGNIVDLLMPPLSPLELALGLAGGGLTRGICVGLVSTLAVSFLLPIHVHDWFFIVFHAIGAR
jgi:ABC-2 type transporter.